MRRTSLQVDSTSHYLQDLRYSLAKRVPDMMDRFTIVTTYGEIYICPEFAEAFRNNAFEVLQYQLNQAMANAQED